MPGFAPRVWTAPARARLRPALALVAGLLAVSALLTSVIAVWAHDSVFDETTMATAVDRALDDADVTDALARRVADALVVAVALDELVAATVPDDLDAIEPAILDGLVGLLHRELAATLSEPDVRDAIVGAVRAAHRGFVRVLEGDGLLSGATITDDAVTVNFLPLLVSGLRIAQRLGIVAPMELPELDAAGASREQIEELEAALQRDLPDDLAQIVVYRSDAIANLGTDVAVAQRALGTLRAVVLLVIALAVALTVATILLARDRRRAGLIFALATSTTFLMVRALATAVLEELPGAASSPGARAAISAISRALADELLASLAVVAVAGAAAAVLLLLLDVRTRPRPVVTRGPATLTALADHRSVPAGTALLGALAVLSIGGFGLGTGLIATTFAGVGIALWWSSPTTTERARPIVHHETLDEARPSLAQPAPPPDTGYR